MSWLPAFNRPSKSQDGDYSVQSGTVSEVMRDSKDKLPALLSEISEFWFTKCEADNVPDWTHFTPHTHTKFLPHIVLWEVVDGSYLARIVGETVANFLPVKIANHCLADISIDEVASLSAELDQTIARNVPMDVNQRNAWILEDEIVHRRTVHLPFRANHGTSNRVLSVMTFTTEPKLDI